MCILAEARDSPPLSRLADQGVRLYLWPLLHIEPPQPVVYQYDLRVRRGHPTRIDRDREDGLRIEECILNEIQLELNNERTQNVNEMNDRIHLQYVFRLRTVLPQPIRESSSTPTPQCSGYPCASSPRLETVHHFLASQIKAYVSTYGRCYT
jgi:hypothetical protein